MYCTNPSYVGGIGFIKCRKCTACLNGKKKEWADRLIIERAYWPYSYFVSLTYSPENMPVDMSLDPQAMVDWKKRLGYYFGQVPQLYYCGEYGDEGDLPHYHAIIYCDRDGFDLIRKSWTLGRISIEYATPERCCYTAGYVTEKLTKPERTDGRHPEFHGASRKPPLGYRLLVDILEKMALDEGFRERMLRHTFAPYSVMIGGKNITLPPYIRNKLGPLWKLYNEDKQLLFKKQKEEESKLILRSIEKNLQKLHVLDLPEAFTFTNSKGEEIIVEPHHLSWRQIKYKARHIYNSLEARNRKAFNLRHRRM